MDNPDLQETIFLPPDEAVRAFEARDRLLATVRWTDLFQAEHARHFTVAKIADLDLLADVQAAVADIIANGGTFEEFRANIEPILRKAGWWGLVTNPALTGTNRPVAIGPARLRTIYDTNLRVSRAAGHWDRIQALKKERPFLRYTATLDRRTRPLHRSWHGTILPVDDEWWDTHYPPNGWFCRCTVIQLSQRDLDMNGWKISKRPPLDPRVFTRAGSAESVEVPRGIDPGFAYNSGKASMAAIMDKLRRSLERAAPVDLAAARETLNAVAQSDAFLEALSEAGAAVPVMVLATELTTAIGAQASVVQLSADSYAKQFGNTARSPGHPELTIAQYRRLPEIGAVPDLVLKQGNQRLLIFKEADNRWLVATVKVTASGGELFLVSYRYARNADIARLRAAHEVVVRRGG